MTITKIVFVEDKKYLLITINCFYLLPTINNNNIPQRVFVILKYFCAEFYSFVQICSSKLMYLTHVYTMVDALQQ